MTNKENKKNSDLHSQHDYMKGKHLTSLDLLNFSTQKNVAFYENKYNGLNGVFGGFIKDGLGYAVAHPLNQYGITNNNAGLFDGKVGLKGYKSDIHKLINEPFAPLRFDGKINDFSKVGDWAYKNSSFPVGKMLTAAFQFVHNNYNQTPFQCLAHSSVIDNNSQMFSGLLANNFPLTAQHNFAQELSGVNQLIVGAGLNFQTINNSHIKVPIQAALNQLAVITTKGGIYGNLNKAHDGIADLFKLGSINAQVWPKHTLPLQEIFGKVTNAPSSLIEINKYALYNLGDQFGITGKTCTAFNALNKTSLALNTFKSYSPESYIDGKTNYHNISGIDADFLKDTFALNHALIIPKTKSDINEERLCKLEIKLKAIDIQIDIILSRPKENNQDQELTFLRNEVKMMRLELASYEINTSNETNLIDMYQVMELLKISESTFYRYKADWVSYKVGSKSLYKVSEIMLSIKKFLK